MSTYRDGDEMLTTFMVGVKTGRVTMKKPAAAKVKAEVFDDMGVDDVAPEYEGYDEVQDEV
jgi:hypothetical protein